ncbi:MAG: beta-lactamase family protein [Ardenticatenaceae bacterium]|nr:beta-lactamase family protein [Ardenticatenaceae bacterium]
MIQWLSYKDHPTVLPKNLNGTRLVICLGLAALLLMLSSCRVTPPFAITTDLQLERPLPELVSFLETYIPEQMAQNHVPGLSIALIREGNVVWTESFGVTNSITKTPVTEQTIFEAASLGKPVAAYGALHLVERGDMMLDTPLNDYLPQPFLMDPQGQREISLGNVLSHSSGLSNNMRSFDTKVYFPPGQAFQYSGMGYLYAQTAVESVSGMTFEQHLQQSVFELFDMKDSSYLWHDKWADRISYGHITGLNLFGFLSSIYLGVWLVVFVVFMLMRAFRVWRGSGKKTIRNGVVALFAGIGLMALIAYNSVLPVPLNWSQNREVNAASSLYTTTDDMAAFLRQLLDASQGSTTEQQMLEAQIQVDQNLFWGNGIGIQKNPQGRTSFWQWGSNLDFQGFMIGYPEEQTGVVILTNSSNGLSVIPGIVEQAVGGDQYWWLMLNE